MAPRLVWFLVGYATVGTWLTTSVFGRRLMRLHFGILRREGDLRFDLVRVRENAGVPPKECGVLTDPVQQLRPASMRRCVHAETKRFHFLSSSFSIRWCSSSFERGVSSSKVAAHLPFCCVSTPADPLMTALSWLAPESIAFYNGEHREAAIAGGRLAALVATTRLKIAWEAALSLWTNGYSYATVRCGNSGMLPAAFAQWFRSHLIYRGHIGFSLRLIPLP